MLGVAAVTLWRRVPVTVVFLAGYGAVILAWPFEPTRFALVWWPVLAGLFLAGVRTTWVWRPFALGTRTLRLAALAGVAVVAAGYGTYNARGVRDKWWVNIQSDGGTRAKPIAEWVARSTQPQDVVVSDHDLIVYLYTGRRAVPTSTFTALGHITPLSTSESATVLKDLVTRLRPRWFIVSTQQGIAAATVLAEERPPQLRYAGSISVARVYEPVFK